MNEAMSQPLLMLLLKGTLLLLCAALVCRVLMRASSAARHLVWSAAIGGVLGLPLLSLSLPHWNLAVAQPAVWSSGPGEPAHTVPWDSPRSGIHAKDAANAPPIPASSVRQGRALPNPPESPANPMRKPSPGVSPAVAAAIVWLAGFLVVLCQLIAGLRRIGMAGRLIRPLDQRTINLAGAARRQLGIKRGVAVARSIDGGGIGVPVTWGIFRPRVLLPAQSETWSESCLRAALLHEFAHIRRFDWQMQIAAHVACAVYWFHPLVWLAARRLRAESECACDDLVLLSGMPAVDYALRLVEVVRSIPIRGGLPHTVAIAMAQPSEVEGRLKAVLAKGVNRRPLTRRTQGAVAVALGMILLPLAALHVVARAEGGHPLSAPATSRRHAGQPILRDPNRHVEAYGTTAADHQTHTSLGTPTGNPTDDMASLKAEFETMVAQGVAPRPGATAYRIPSKFGSLTNLKTVYLTPAQRETIVKIGRDVQSSPPSADSSVTISGTNVRPADSNFLGGTFARPSALWTNSPLDGPRKFADFVANRTREFEGIFDGKRVNSAPDTMPSIPHGAGALEGAIDTLLKRL